MSTTRPKIQNILSLLLAVAIIVGVIGLGLIPQDTAAQEPTSNEIAAGGFPLPGDVRLYAQELACQNAIETPGYYSSINGAEIADGLRSGFFPCATFTGSFNGPNQVFAYKSEDEHVGAYYINNRKPGELYLVGGGTPPDEETPQAPYVAKVDASTGKTIWKTYVDNPWASGTWNANSNLNILENGNIPFSWSNQIVLLDGDTGRILAHNTLPTGGAPENSVNFKHVTVAPDGTLIVKDQTLPEGCTGHGTMVIIKCVGLMGLTEKPNSQLVALHPDTLEILDDITLPGASDVPHAVAPFEDKYAVYLGFNESARRVIWDPEAQKLFLDELWQVFPMRKGQTSATAPTFIGDWVIYQLNGNGSFTVASSLISINIHDVSKQNILFPFGDLDVDNKEWSFATMKAGSDPENDMVYSIDTGMKKVGGIKVDRETGEMKVVWVKDIITNTFQPTIGPKDQRVMIVTNIKPNDPEEPVNSWLFAANYTEQVIWLDAATGRLLAESDYFEPLSFGALLTPGFGGRVYASTTIGKGFYILQVKPAAE